LVLVRPFPCPGSHTWQCCVSVRILVPVHIRMKFNVIHTFAYIHMQHTYMSKPSCWCWCWCSCLSIIMLHNINMIRHGHTVRVGTCTKKWRSTALQLCPVSFSDFISTQYRFLLTRRNFAHCILLTSGKVKKTIPKKIPASAELQKSPSLHTLLQNRPVAENVHRMSDVHFMAGAVEFRRKNLLAGCTISLIAPLLLVRFKQKKGGFCYSLFFSLRSRLFFLKGTVVLVDLRFFLSEVSTWVPDSHSKIFSSFASSSWSYLNLKFNSPLYHAARSRTKIVNWESFNTWFS
jgi:hypothetical protein